MVTTEIGFWKYVVSDDEKYILLSQGMDNWVNPELKNQSKLMLYSLMVRKYGAIPWDGKPGGVI